MRQRESKKGTAEMISGFSCGFVIPGFIILRVRPARTINSGPLRHPWKWPPTSASLPRRVLLFIYPLGTHPAIEHNELCFFLFFCRWRWPC